MHQKSQGRNFPTTTENIDPLTSKTCEQSFTFCEYLTRTNDELCYMRHFSVWGWSLVTLPVWSTSFVTGTARISRDVEEGLPWHSHWLAATAGGNSPILQQARGTWSSKGQFPHQQKLSGLSPSQGAACQHHGVPSFEKFCVNQAPQLEVCQLAQPAPIAPSPSVASVPVAPVAAPAVPRLCPPVAPEGPPRKKAKLPGPISTKARLPGPISAKPVPPKAMPVPCEGNSFHWFARPASARV